MPLADAGNDRLVRLGVVVRLKGRIFLVELVQPGLQLLLVRAGGGMHRHLDDRLREFDLRQTHRVLACRERIVGVRALELRHAADVARAQAIDLDALFPLSDGKMVQLLRSVARCVEGFLTVDDAAGKNPEKTHVADVRLGHRLEHECRERLGVVSVNLDGGVALGALEGVNLFHLEGIGQQLDDRVEHRLDAVIQLARDAEEREQLHALHRFFHSRNRLVAADLTSLEVSLQ